MRHNPPIITPLHGPAMDPASPRATLACFALAALAAALACYLAG